MKKFLTFCFLTFTLVVLFVSCKYISDSSSGGDIVVASKGFTEQDILSELLAQQIQQVTHSKVARRRFASTLITHDAIASGKIDSYIEYTGTAFTVILKQKVISEAKIVYARVKQGYAKKFNLEVMEPLGFEDTFAMIVRGEDAKRYNIQTLSDAAKYSSKWRGGFDYEFMEREDGFPGLAKTYGLHFSQFPRTMELGLIYRALLQKEVDLINGNSTDGQISRLGLAVLKDNLHYFPPYEATPIVRKETLKKYPKLKQAIAQLIGQISADEMRRLNSLVEGELRDVKDVVREFRLAKGLAVNPH